MESLVTGGMMGWSSWSLGGNQPDYDGMESLVHLVNLTENNVIELQVTLLTYQPRLGLNHGNANQIQIRWSQ